MSLHPKSAPSTPFWYLWPYQIAALAKEGSLYRWYLRSKYGPRYAKFALTRYNGDLPKVYVKHPEVIGVCVGRCVRESLQIIKPGIGFTEGVLHIAHAHCRKDDLQRGWICLSRPECLLDKRVLLHELAHMKSPMKVIGAYEAIHFHHQEWMDTLLKLGGTYRPFLMPVRHGYVRIKGFTDTEE